MKYFLISISFLILSGCSTKHDVISRPIDKPKLSIGDPSPLELEQVKFIVVTEGNVDEVFNRLKEQGKEPVLFSLTGDNYKSLSLNVDQIKNYIILQKKIIILYREYYENGQKIESFKSIFKSVQDQIKK